MDWILLAQDTEVADGSEKMSRLGALAESVMSPMGHVLISALLLGIGIYMLLPPRGRGKALLVGAILASMGVVLFLIPTIAKLPTAPAFFLLEGLAVLGGLGTVTSRSPVYSAIWFASALLAMGALLLMGGAQFLGVATVAVYAGAIVVTFLFVLMLAQPEGHAVYDRIGWGWFPSMCASIAGVSVAAIIAAGLLGGPAESKRAHSSLRAKVEQAVRGIAAQRIGGAPDSEVAVTHASKSEEVVQHVELTRNEHGAPLLNVTLVPDSAVLSEGDAVLAAAIRVAARDLDPATRISISERDILASDHVARLGGELFGRHLIAIQVAAVLLLVALVGAIAMAIHGKDLAPKAPRSEVATR